MGSCVLIREGRAQNSFETRPEALRPSHPVFLSASLLSADAMRLAILRMVHNASTLTPGKKERLLTLCLKYHQVFNAGEKPLTASNLVSFELKPFETNKPVSVP